jgi:hypothetical protein
MSSDKLLTDGFHAFERNNNLRWIDGDAVLPPALRRTGTGSSGSRRRSAVRHAGSVDRTPVPGPVARRRARRSAQGPVCRAGYSGQLGFDIDADALRATASTNALDHQADIAKVQEWLGRAKIVTTRFYDHRPTRPEDSPTFKVSY